MPFEGPPLAEVEALLRMAHSPIRNYIVPGLTSSLVGSQGPLGTVRLFQSEREHQENITPHSHRFDFMCWVLRGSVRNRLWVRSHDDDEDADCFQESLLAYGGEVGQYRKVMGGQARWRYTDQIFRAGQTYSMRHDEVHSIYFGRGAVVVLFEGPTLTAESLVIEPVVNGQVIETMRVLPWMFQQEQPQPTMAARWRACE